jgi:diacylglycerol kinase family enzyme
MGPKRLSADPDPADTLQAPVRPRLSRIEAVVNTASGSVGRDAPKVLKALMAEAGVACRVTACASSKLEGVLQAAIDRGPDLLVVLAGDGTARTAAQLAGMDGPPIAPLAGGTMNLLPHAVYGARPWEEALRETLSDGVETPLAGGVIDGHLFLVAAVVGAPALWAPAREAARERKPREALSHALQALDRSFGEPLRYALDDGPRSATEALVLICPRASRVLDDAEPALEAEALNLRGAGEALRLGLTALAGDWRMDPAVEGRLCRVAHIWAEGGAPALVDGELIQVSHLAEARFVPAVCRVIAPPRPQPPTGEP